MKKNNFSHLIREEMQNRFDSAIKAEIQEHQNCRKELIRQFENLESEVKLLKNDLRSALFKGEVQASSLLVEFKEQKKSLEEVFEDQRRHIRDNVKETKSFISKVKDEFLSADQANDIFSDVSKLHTEIQQMQIEAHEENEKMLRHIHDVSGILYEKFGKEIQFITEKFGKFEKALEDLRKNLTEFYVSNESFLREINAIKKSVFIQEKKIENLYTLIDRMKKEPQI